MANQTAASLKNQALAEELTNQLITIANFNESQQNGIRTSLSDLIVKQEQAIIALSESNFPLAAQRIEEALTADINLDNILVDQLIKDRNREACPSKD